MNEQISNATFAWRVFDDITYKKIETSAITDYSSKFHDPSDPSGSAAKPLVTMAPCGGPIAFIYKKSESNPNDVKYTIIIQNLPNRKSKLRDFDRGTIILADWTINEDLFLVTEDGKYHIVDIFHYNTSNDQTRTLSETVSAIGSAMTFKTNQGTGLVALRKNQEGFVAVKNVYNPVIQTITLPVEARSCVNAWCVLDHADITILYATGYTLSTCNAESSRRDQQTLTGHTDTVIKLVCSSNYKSVAMLKDSGEVLISSRENIAQPQSFVLKYGNPKEKNKINDIAWCGSDTVIGIRSKTNTWFDLLIINAKSSRSMTAESQEAIANDTLCYTSPVFLSTELDGVRIISGRTLDFLQRLPDELHSVLSLMSETPGAKLYSAYLNYKYENQVAELLLNQLKTGRPSYGLEDAVKQCIAAASTEHEPATQKILLKAALFGRSFLSVNLTNPSTSTRPAVSMINDLCTNVIRNLHLINNLHHISISIPITFTEFEIIGTTALIDRLLRRNLHEFATRVTKLLRMPPEEGENRILVQWAVQELVNPSNSNEDAIAEKIKTALANVPGIPFIDIVREAYKLKKYIVVKRLLDVKVSLSDQIDMLLQLNEKEEALQKALACGDTDLALYVLMRIKATEKLPEYLLRLQKLKSLPLKLHLQCLEEMERSNLHTELIKRNPDERDRIAYSHIIQRFTTAVILYDQRTELNSASKLFREMRNETVSQLVDDEARLIARQDELEKKLLNVPLKGLSIVDTIETLLMYNERDAEQMKKEFNINDKRFTWIKIQAYAKKNSWTQLFEFGKKSTSPIGYEPFVDVCLRSNHPDEARRYVDRTIFSSKLDDERLPFMFAKLQMTDEAINAAIKIKSLEALHFIESKCQLNEANLARLQQAREKLQQNDYNPIRGFSRIFNR